jgi:CspA family cold shock protein
MRLCQSEQSGVADARYAMQLRRGARRSISKGVCMGTMSGTIKRLISEKGFGFILAEDGNEYFFHQSACTQVSFSDLREGQSVTFDKGSGPKGPRGENVRLA